MHEVLSGHSWNRALDSASQKVSYKGLIGLIHRDIGGIGTWTYPQRYWRQQLSDSEWVGLED